MWTSKSKEKADDNAAIITRLANTIASQRPDDKDAQWRAQTATALLQDLGIAFQATTAAAESSSIISASPSEPQHSVKLPVELYRMIIGHVNTFRQQSRSREPTLVALSCTCKTLNKIAEEFIYKHPGVLQYYAKGRKFLFSLKIRPTRASLVRSLILDLNRQVKTMDIIASCPNVEFLFVGNGWGSTRGVYVDQLEGLQFILSVCTRLKSLHYFSISMRNAGGPDRIERSDAKNRLSDWISGHTRVEQSLKQLETLGIQGPSAWLLQGSLPYLSSNLTSLQLGWHATLNFSGTSLFDISRQCQNLKILVIEYGLVTAEDLKKACRAWASTLETLKVDCIAENKEWISQVIPHLRKLKVLSLGTNCYVSVDSVNAIANIKTPLERISILDVKGLICESMRETRMASDAANKALADMIEAHSSSLRHVNIFFGVEKVVIQGCKKAKGLRSLTLTLSDEALRQDFDGLLDSCPELVNFPWIFKDYSHRRSEWEDRQQLRMDVEPFEMKLLEGRIIGA